MPDVPVPAEDPCVPCGGPLLYAAENLSLYHGRQEPKHGAEHAHADVQIGFPVSGAYNAAWSTATGQRRYRTVSPGTLLLSASQQPHAVQINRPTEIAVIWIPAPYLARTAAELRGTGPLEVTDRGGTQDTLLQQLCWALLAEVRQHQAPARLYVDAMAHLLAARLIRQHSTRCAPTKPITGGLSPRRLSAVLAYIQENLEQDVALGDLADVCGLSPSHFGPLFRRSIGLSPYQYVLSQRIERAKTLLRAGHLSVGEIALRVGFCDQSQFTRQFKQLVGLTPRAFAKAAS